jgi:DNA-binding MarR family transcriptional regulator
MSAENIYHLSLELQQKNRAVGSLHGTNLTLFESHLLSELEANAAIDSAGLASLLVVDQSTVSRMLKKLGATQHIKREKSSSDSRRMTLRLTKKGLQAIAKIDRQANAILEQLAKNISGQELEHLRSFFQRFCDAFDIPRACSRSGEHPLRVEQRRLARCIKVLTSDRNETPLTPSEHHLLKLLRDRQRALSPKSITRCLDIQGSALSVILKKLKNQKLLLVQSHARDRRVELIAISAEGGRILQEHEQQQLSRMYRVQDCFSPSELTQFSDLFRRFLQDPERTNQAFHHRFLAKKMTSSEERKIARLFFLQQMSEQGGFDAVPEYLFDTESENFALFEGSNLRMVLQLRDGATLCFCSTLPEDEYDFERYFLELVNTNHPSLARGRGEI